MTLQRLLVLLSVLTLVVGCSTETGGAAEPRDAALDRASELGGDTPGEASLDLPTSSDLAALDGSETDGSTTDSSDGSTTDSSDTDASTTDSSDTDGSTTDSSDAAGMDATTTDSSDAAGMDATTTDSSDAAGMDATTTDGADATTSDGALDAGPVADRIVMDVEGAETASDAAAEAGPDASPDRPVAPNRPPEIVSLPVTSALPAMTYRYTLDAFDPDGDTLTLTVVEGPMGLRAEGLSVVFDPRADQAGRHPVRLAVTDGRGGRAEQSYTLGVTGLPDTAAPVVRITAPALNAVLRAESTVTGTVTDANLLGYELHLRAADGSSDSVLATGEREVSAGTLGTVDPALVEGGFYTLELVARDLGGNESRASVRVRIDPEGVPAASVQVERTDLDLPVSTDGFPFRLRRVYDSARLGTGDFGRGWWLERIEYRVSESSAPGQGPYAVGRTLFGCVITDRPLHQVQVMTPRGTAVFGWEPVLLFGSCDRVLPAWRDISNTRATLDCNDCGAFGSMSQLLGGNVMADTALFDPSVYTATLPDGITMRIHQSQGLEQVHDRFGHSLTFTREAIRHDGGEITLTRDASGRITRATAPGGAAITYRYDLRGDLAESAHTSGRRETYEYDGRHLLLRARDGAGVVRVLHEFDRAGRLVAATDETGVRVERSEDTTARSLTLRAATGLVRTLRYDAQGSIIEETDARGGRWLRSYDPAGRVTQETDPLGAIDRVAYDSSGRISTLTNSLGGRFSYTYGANDAVASLVSSTGAALRRVFATAAPRAMTQETALDGSVQDFTVGAAGFVSRLTERRPAGDARPACTLDLGSDRAGRLSTTASSDGERWTYDNGPDGMPRTVHRGGERYDFTYDSEGRLASESAGAGRRLERSYDPEGRLLRSRDALGRETTFMYDPFGRMATQRLPDGANLAYTWSPTGDLLSRTDAVGVAERYERNHAGDVTRAVYADNGDYRVTYDTRGRPSEITEAAGERWRNQFDAVGRLTRLEDAVGAVWQMRWPDNVVVAPDGEEQPGSPTEVIDPLGRRTALELDGGGRPTRVTFPDGGEVRASYALQGETTSTTDEEGRVTRYELRCNGDLEAVVMPGGGRLSYEYNAAGRVIGRVDPRGGRTGFEHDTGGYLTRVTLAGGRSWELSYDAAGQVSAERLLDGATRRYTHDLRGRLTRIEQPDGTSIDQGYGPGELPTSVRDATGELRIRRDAQNRALRTDFPGGAFVERAYDGAGRLISRRTAAGTVRYEYDAAGRITAMIDAAGGRMEYTLDAVGRRTRVRYPNGVVRSNTWDLRDRLTRLEDRDGGGTVIQSWEYVYDRSGRRTSARGDDGTLIRYEYDPAGRLTHEQRTGAGAYDLRYTLDAAGNRTSMLRDGVATTYTYDIDDTLTRRVGPEGVTVYRVDSRGRRTAEEGPGSLVVRYTWDARDRLTRIEREGTGGPTEQTEMVYDALGGLGSVRGARGLRRMLFDSATSPAELVEVGEGTAVQSVAWVDGDHVSTSGSVRTVALVDALGTPTMVTRGDGTVLERVGFDAWGRRLSGVYGDGDVGFEGHIALGATGLTWMRARVYDSTTGTFLSRDPAPPDGSDPRTLNAYVFAAGNPVMFIDPTGESVLSEYAAVVRDAVRRVVVLARSYATMIARAAKRICAAIQRAILFPGSRVLSMTPFSSVPGWTRQAIEFFVSTTLFGPEGTLVVEITRPTTLLRYFGTGGSPRGRGPFTFTAPRGFRFLPRGLYRQVAAILPKWSDLANRTFLRGRAGQIVLVGCTRRQGRYPGGGLQIGLPN